MTDALAKDVISLCSSGSYNSKENSERLRQVFSFFIALSDIFSTIDTSSTIYNLNTCIYRLKYVTNKFRKQKLDYDYSYSEDFNV